MILSKLWQELTGSKNKKQFLIHLAVPAQVSCKVVSYKKKCDNLFLIIFVSLWYVLKVLKFKKVVPIAHN